MLLQASNSRPPKRRRKQENPQKEKPRDNSKKKKEKEKKKKGESCRGPDKKAKKKGNQGQGKGKEPMVCALLTLHTFGSAILELPAVFTLGHFMAGRAYGRPDLRLAVYMAGRVYIWPCPWLAALNDH